MQESNSKVKVVLLGDGGTGKTTFITRFTTGEFVPQYQATMGVQVYSFSLPTSRGLIGFECWDSSGQETFGTQKDVCYHDAKFAILFFDVQSRLTYKNCPLWYREVTRVEPEVSVVSVGNKVDLENRQVKPKQVTFHKKVEIPYIEMSAKSNYNVDQPFLIFARSLFNDSTVELTDEVKLRISKLDVDLIGQQEEEKLMEDVPKKASDSKVI